MSEATPSPDPRPPAGPGPSGPAAPAPWAPPDPLPAPKPWATPDPWPLAWSRPAAETPPAPGPHATAAGPPVPTMSPDATAAGSPRATQPAFGTFPPAPLGAPTAAVPPPGTAAQTFGYPSDSPPFAHPSAPATRGGRTSRIWIAAPTVVAILFCGCFGVGVVARLSEDPQVVEEPSLHDPNQGWTEPPAEPTLSPTPARTQRPVTRPTAGPAPVTVVYEVTGDGRADISYFDAEGDLIHVDGVQLPWRITIRTDGKSRVMVEATWSAGADLPISCKVTVTGAGAPVVDAVDGIWRTTCAPE
ncbi:membrane protein [Micromonospora rhizosphaerae]|uniref:Membrane protein n=1 Tax=Micromonospora rhizosphaerae TaxID=568872 RepID=A0A1C6R832_9ACTN|nr:MmpS family transport accessory protein [Micromonospora rhizosphaerae]SCL13210.1 membrane protein [Micromonospora rhizosphaerae]